MAFLSTGKNTLAKVESLDEKVGQLCASVNDINNNIDRHNVILQDISHILSEMSEKIDNLQSNMDMFNKCITEEKKEFVDAEEITQKSLEDIGKLMITGNNNIAKVLSDYEVLTEKVLEEYRINLNSVIEGIMLSNLGVCLSQIQDGDLNGK